MTTLICLNTSTDGNDVFVLDNSVRSNSVHLNSPLDATKPSWLLGTRLLCALRLRTISIEL